LQESVKPKDSSGEPPAQGGKRNAEADFHGQKRSNDAHASIEPHADRPTAITLGAGRRMIRSGLLRRRWHQARLFPTLPDDTGCPRNKCSLGGGKRASWEQ
jgi:hypothetical protein